MLFKHFLSTKNFVLAAWAALAALAFVAAGCDPGRTYFTVTPSPLNYANISYAASSNNLVRMEFSGTGYCVMRKGGNPNFANPFALEAHETQEIRLNLPPEHVNAIFQTLVREGVFDPEPRKTRSLAFPYVGMTGRIENSGFNRAGRTPELLEVAQWMAAMFERSQQQNEKLRQTE